MLIEDLTILSEPDDIFDGETIIIKAINMTYAINALSSATISVEISEDGAIHYHEFPTYDLSTIVGKEITIRWKDKELEIFKGRVTGIQLDKSESNISYSINCSGGPLAMYNTELSIKGWYPQAALDNPLTKIAFSNALVRSGWSSPVSFIRKLTEEFKKIAVNAFGKNTNSKGTLDAATIVHDQILTDINNLLEPTLLQQFWGFVGEFDGQNESFKLAIERRMEELITVDGASYTFWQILLLICEEIGVYVVPWINKTLVLPSALFSSAPKANVLFPSLIRDITVVTDPFTFPDQLIIPTDTYITTSIAKALEGITKSSSIAVPPNDQIEDRNSPYQGNRYKVVVAPKYAKFILQYPTKEVINKQKIQQKKDESQQNAEKDPSLASQSYNLYESFARNMGEFLYKKMRSERNTAQIVCAFQPYMIPGFSCYTIDGREGGMNFRGTVSQLNHTITELDAQTTVTLTNVVFPVTEQFTINSPLWRELLPNAQNPAGRQIALELMSLVDGFPIGAAVQIVADDNLLQNDAMDDASEAADFTGRIS